MPSGTAYVIEDVPEAGHARWQCGGAGFDDVDEAVAHALTSAATVLVRTLDGRFFAAGAPVPGPDGAPPAPWPPSAKERRAIEAAYDAACAEAERERVAAEAHPREREAWLAEHAPALSGTAPAHECLLLLPDARAEIQLEELGPDGTPCAARRVGGGPSAFGELRDVVQATAGADAPAGLADAVVAAIERERTWIMTGRRTMLVVLRGRGTMLHVTASANRASIARHGLDWGRMGAAPGVAGSPTPELPAVFLCADEEDATWFADMAQHPCDLWAVDVDGLWLEGDPGSDGGGGENWLLCPEPIGPERLTLVERDRRPDPRWD